MLTLGIEYLTGHAVATSTGDRTQPEWPPHPGRIFMALAAAYFETRPNPSEASAMAEWKQEAEALRWLERQDAPGLFATDCDARSVLDVYVKPNDFSIFDTKGKPIKVPNPFKLGLNAKQREQQIKSVKEQREILPSYRNGKERTFPTVHPHKNQVYLQWQSEPPSTEMRTALERLCAKVIRIGHSSSLVRMWVEANEASLACNWLPEKNALASATGPVQRLRIVSEGCLDYLQDQYNGEAVDRFYDFTVRIQSAKEKEQKQLKAAFEEAFGVSWKASLSAPSSRRPTLSMTQAYRNVDESTPDSAKPVQTVFDGQLLILDKREGPVLGLESTWQLLTALRGAIEKAASPTPEWVSGHQPDGKPSEKPHLALIPLGFVGHKHADGHLLGVALAFPRDVPLSERGKLIGRLLHDTTGMPKDVRLTLGKLGVWTLGEEQRPAPPQALRTETWTGTSQASKTWASVSPVVLDQHPKSDPRKDPVAYRAEVAAIISASCRRIGLPDPVEIEIDKTSWHRGAPRAKPGPDGFPLMPQRPGGANRRQVHVWLRFDRPVIGPVLLGAGRYRGYGFCKPWSSQLQT